jgi:hypothetical protein
MYLRRHAFRMPLAACIKSVRLYTNWQDVCGIPDQKFAHRVGSTERRKGWRFLSRSVDRRGQTFIDKGNICIRRHQIEIGPLVANNQKSGAKAYDDEKPGYQMKFLE